MKKIMIAAAIVCTAMLSHAGAINWEFMTYEAIPGTDGTGAWSGSAIITCTELSGWSQAVTVGNDGNFDVFAEVDSVAYTDYNFTLSATAIDGSTYSAKAVGSADDVMGGFVGFDAGTWVAAPEPTSGLLLLIGMAGLALKRKRA